MVAYHLHCSSSNTIPSNKIFTSYIGLTVAHYLHPIMSPISNAEAFVKIHFDIIIIGAGTAGLPIAARCVY
jgi:hypothetical protein